MHASPRLSVSSTSNTTSVVDLCFDQCVARKLRAWFARFPPTQRVAATVDDDNTDGGPSGQGGTGVAGEEEDEEEAYALSGGE